MGVITGTDKCACIKSKRCNRIVKFPANSELEAEDDMVFGAESALEVEDVEGYADGVVFAVSPLFVYSFAAFTLFVWTAFIYCCYVKECKEKKVKKVSVYDVDSENEVLNANAA